MFKTCWDVLVLLATIYVAVVVPYNAVFVTEESYDFPGEGCFLGNESSYHYMPLMKPLDPKNELSRDNKSQMLEEEDQMKRSIVVDVIVEAVFIVGKSVVIIRNPNLVIDPNPILYFWPNQNRKRNAYTETESKPKVNRKYSRV